jgi:O-antigen/teichoic acid export membrane protein
MRSGSGSTLTTFGRGVWAPISTSSCAPFSSDNIVIAQILGPDAVAQYSVPARMFNVISMLVSTILSPLWPAYGEALARGDLAWVTKTLKRSLLLGLSIAVPANLLLVLFASKLLHLWIGAKITVPLSLLIGLGLWGIDGAIGNPLAYFLNAAGVIRLQAILALLMASANLALSILLTRSIGIPGPVWGSVITHTAIILIPCAFLVPKLLDRLEFRQLQSAAD